jgi:monoterpene epsilon-lactone hydrolase
VPGGAMQDLIDALRDQQKASARQAPLTLEQSRAAFAGQDLSARSMAVAGASAGGGLAVALLVATRDAADALPAAAVLMSPTVDLTSSGASMTERVDQDPFSTPALLHQLASDYLAGADPQTPLASPLFASLAGVDVTLKIGEGLPHVYPIMLGTPEAAEATEQTGKFLRARVR